MKRSTSIVLVSTLLGAVSSSALGLASCARQPAGTSPPEAEVPVERAAAVDRIDIDVQEAPAETVLERVAGALGLTSWKIEADDAVPPVTMTLRNVSPETALHALGESLGCRPRLDSRQRSVVLACSEPGPEVEASVRASALDHTFRISLRDACLGEMLDAFERAIGLEISAPADLRAARITLETGQVPVRDILDSICEVHGCRWREVAEGEVEINVPGAGS